MPTASPADTEPDEEAPQRASLQRALDHVLHLLPEQKPIERFVHHNTLHAFEALPFDEAVRAAHEVYGAQPYMQERAFRKAYASGRILDADLDDALTRHVPDAPTPLGDVTLRQLVKVAMLHMPEHTERAGLGWLIAERGALTTLPDALSRGARERLLAQGRVADTLGALWRASSALARTRAQAQPARAPLVRPRDLWLERTGEDLDQHIHPWLIRWCGAYLDHGVSLWAAPQREAGLLAFLLDQLAQAAPEPARWRRIARQRAQALKRDGADAATATLRCARELGIAPDQLDAWVERSLLALPGWAGMCAQLEHRPDTAPGSAPPVKLADLMAARALLEVAALQDALERRDAPPAPTLGARLALLPAPAPDLEAQAQLLAWQLYHLMMHLGVSGPQLDALDARQRAALCDALTTHDTITRRALWQLAYERRYRVELLDGLLAHHAQPQPARAPQARAQLIFCIDDREESLRRHLEEIDPHYETLGAAGFFGVASWYQGLNHPIAVPLCPPVITPRHYIYERAVDDAPARPAGAPLAGAYAAAHTRHGATLWAGGALAILGWHKLAPMMTRLLSPRHHARAMARVAPPALATQLVIDREDDALTSQGWHQGYTHEEMRQVLRKLFEELGLTHDFAPLVAVVGHGATSVNNPHGAAYGCGACGGGHGGPNGRAFALMANKPQVRALLRQDGILIPDGTWFIGGAHNTTDDSVVFQDLDKLPSTHRARFAQLERDLQEACQRDAHERCRRFDSAPLDLTPAQALAHVQARAVDLGQPRPEYGHTANALCVVGRRAWTRGLFLDRRAFLVSYDPHHDQADGAILERLLASVGPVGAGINLEYYFSFVDNAIYGSGSKLPHNVTGLVGVMDGHCGDLRTGLPWQMVELHEPVRLLVLIEGTPERIGAIVARHPGLHKLVSHRWILAAVYDPTQNKAWFLEEGGFEPHHTARPDGLPVRRVDRSDQVYQGRRELLAPASVLTRATRTRGGDDAVA